MQTPPAPEQNPLPDTVSLQEAGYPAAAPSTSSEAPPAAEPRTLFDSLLGRAATTLGLDRAVVFTILARGWSSLAGIGTLTLIARFLTPAEQGYYYTFYSLVALQIVFELGFSVVILQTASHEAAHLVLALDGTIAGPRSAHARLASVLQKSVRWYSIAALLMAAIVLPLGMRFFSEQSPVHAPGRNAAAAWLLPWILVIVSTMFTFQVDPLFSFLEGCGYVAKVARARLAQAITGTVLGWTALLLHHGLLAPGFMILGQALAGSSLLYNKRNLLLPLLRYKPGEFQIQWGSEVWPFQWRIAVSWISGYLIFQLFNPILFHYRGAVEAGQMGMSTNICATLSSMAIAWMNTKAAPFGQMIARRDFARLDRVFFRALLQSTTAAALACSAVLIVVVYLRSRQVPFALRLLPTKSFAILLAATILNIVVFAEALYLRAHKQEKFMINSILGALWMAPASFFLGRRYGAFGISLSYLVGSLCIGIGYGTFTFQKWRRIWHAV